MAIISGLAKKDAALKFKGNSTLFAFWEHMANFYNL